MPNPRRKFNIEEARAFAKKNPKAFNQALDKINPDPYRGTKKFAELLIQQYPERYKNFTPQHFISMLDSISKVESGNKNIAQRSINPRTKKAIDGPARGYYQMETGTTPTAQKRYQNYQDILKPLTAVPLPNINVPASGDVRSLSKDEQARLAIANMSATAAAKKERLNPLDSQNSWLNFHWNGSPADKPARQQHWKETFGYGDGGQIEPTRADSLALLNNSKSLEKYYSKYDLVNKNEATVKADTTEQGYILPGFDAHDYNARNFKDFYSNNSTVRVPSKNGNAMNLPRNSLPKQQYRRDIDNNKYYQRESSDRILDTRAPMALFDKRIMPNVYNSYSNNAPNDPMNGDGVTIYGYDPLSITPWDMLNSKDKANRISQFGVAGTPYKSMKEYKASNPSGRPNPPVSKMDTINKKIPVDYNQQLSTDSPMTVPQFHPYAGYNNPNIPKGYYELGQGKKIETFKEGGEIEPYITNDPNDPRIQAYRDSSDLYSDYRIQQELLKTQNPKAITNHHLDYSKNKSLQDSNNSNKPDFYYKPRDIDNLIINQWKRKNNPNIKIIEAASPEVTHSTIKPKGVYMEDIENGLWNSTDTQRAWNNDYSNVKPIQPVIYQKPQSKETSKTIGQTWSEKINVPTIKPKAKPKPIQQFQDTVVVPQVTPEAQTQINTGSSTPVTLGMSSPDSSTGKRLYRYGNKDISEQDFNKYKTLGKHKIVEYNFGGTMGNILSAASPFLNLIPGAGTIASPIAAMAGQILQGTNQPQQQSVQQPRQQYIQRQPMNNYNGQGYATGGRMINEGNGIEHAYGLSHEQGGIQYDGQSEIEGGEKVLNGNYVLTDQPNSNLDKTQMSISRRFDKDHKAISDRNPRSNSDKAKEFLKQDAMQKNDIYLQARHEKMMNKIGRITKKYGYGGDLESLSAELGVYQNGGKKSMWNTPMNQRQQTTIFDNSQVPVYLDRYGVTLPDMTNINSSKRSQTGNSQYSDIYSRYQDAIRPSEETRLNHPIYNGPQAPDQYDTPDYDARNPNDYANRRLPANAPDKVRTQKRRAVVNTPRTPEVAPSLMQPIQPSGVNNQRVQPPQTPQNTNYQDPVLYNQNQQNNQQPNQSMYRQDNSWNGYDRPGDPYNVAKWLNSFNTNQSTNEPQQEQGQGANFGRIAETLGTYAPGIYNLARGIFDKTDQMNAGDYMIPQQSPYLIPTQTGEGEIRDAYTRGLYDMRGSGTYSKLGQVNLTNQRAKNNYERKLQIMGANAGIRNQTASQNSNINAQNAQMKQGVYDWNARSRAQKGNFVGQGISDLSTGIQNERNYRNDLTGIDMAFDNPTTGNYIEYLRSGRRQPRTK